MRSVRQHYWSVRERLPRVSHMLAVLPDWARAAARLAALAVGARTRGHRVIAIALVEHFGDLICAEPISRWIRARNPEATIVWITGRAYGDLVSLFPAVDAVQTVQCLTTWIALRRLPLFAAVHDLHLNRRICPRCRIALSKTTGDTSITADNYYDVDTLFGVLCRHGGIPPFRDASRLALSEAAVRAVDLLELPRRFIAIHTRSNEESRDWDTVKWRRLVQWIVSTLDLAVVEIGQDAVAAIDHRSYVDLTRRTDLPSLIEVVRRSIAFVGVDSGPAHIANALDKPAVLIMGRYRTFEQYMPYNGRYGANPDAYIVRAQGDAATVPLSSVQERLVTLLRQPGDVARVTDPAQRAIQR